MRTAQVGELVTVMDASHPYYGKLGRVIETHRANRDYRRRATVEFNGVGKKIVPIDVLAVIRL